MVTGIATTLFEFQEEAVIKLLDLCSDSRSKQTIIMKAPTGSGKTIILIDYVDEYLNKIDSNTAFIWLCPGKGNLEEQSREKMRKFAPHLNTQNLFEALENGFPPESITFINWELVTKRGNTAIRDSERKNLYDHIADAHRKQITFIVVIDEEHSNNTAKARAIIDAFAAKKIVRVSATAQQNKRYEYFEIDEVDVINAGLITKALYVNEGVTDGVEIDEDYNYLIDLADAKRRSIDAHYKSIGKKIRPLVLIQFPNGQPETIAAVERKLESMNYTYDNGMVSKWMSEDKRDIPDDLTENDGQPVFLLMKQAISTGWDCPRAKILVKLREGKNENFEIQTIGRIRRMPEARHYEDDVLDFCYVYTFDEKYKEGMLASMDKAYETRRLFLKPICKTFSLEKQLRDLDFNGLGEREVLNKIYDALVKKYKLSSDKKQNEMLLSDAGYLFGNQIRNRVLHGQFVRTSAVAESNNYYTAFKRVDTHKYGIQLLHSVDAIKTTIGMTTGKVKTILERLFRKDNNNYKKILSLDTAEFYAFIINNEQKLKMEFREVTADMEQQRSFVFNPKKSIFHIPEQDFFKYDSTVKNETEYVKNAYMEYTSGFVSSVVRSTSEMLFEQYCEKRSDIEWLYKNGDKGQQYFSIVYIDGVQNQWLFYADYIVMKKDGTVWIIETKGGESKGINKNRDIQIQNKFNAFKIYAAEKRLNWGFVRDKDNQLYINNTEFAIDMADEHWVPIAQVF
ncbi:DNA helicase [Ruminococcus sp. AM28-41]|jgi:type III restriction enzyme|uniref:DEAD/DEAH box helicase n=1 Tax=Blautia wexlerae TaxID=418240 RepID=UPI000E5186B8|nr:DEAD/DEAH box helicase family protein [Blautia wexlerae]MDB6469788.1 DEAD/DEAH box helicase family protein [Blautia wexlerae]RHT60100.1 DNA helicase [Ruminococcus sp. AM28-41]